RRRSPRSTGAPAASSTPTWCARSSPSSARSKPKPFPSRDAGGSGLAQRHGGQSALMNREERRHPEKTQEPSVKPSEQMRDTAVPQDVADPRAKNSGHKKKTADKWNQ